MKYDIFISYRHSGGEYTAKIIKDRLEDLGYKVFFDVESLRSGNFNTKLYSVIDECKDFILILSPDCLERCSNPNDWVNLEITHALQKGINIIPVILRGFEFPSELPADIEPIRYKSGIQASPEFFDAFVEKLTKSFLAAKPNIKNRVTQNTLFKRTWPVLLSLIVLIGLVGGAVLIFDANKNIYPKNRNDENLTGEVLQYIQSNISLANEISGDMAQVYESCDTYLNHNDSLTYQETVSQIDTTYNQLSTMKATDAALKDDLSAKIDSSPFDKADLKALNSYVEGTRSQMLDKLAITKMLIDPSSAVEIPTKQKLIKLDQDEMDVFSSEIVYYTNSLLIPVSENHLKDFKDSLTTLTNLPYEKYTWLKTQDELKRCMLTNESKLQSTLQEESSLIGNQNFSLMQEKKQLIDYALSLGLTQKEAEDFVAKSMKESDDITALKSQLEKDKLDLENLRKEAAQKFAPSSSDEPGILWGKMLRFLTLSMPDDAIKCVQAYQQKVKDTDPDSEVYVPIVIRFIQEIGNTGIDYGLVVVGYEPDKPHHALYKIGDIIIALNKNPCRTTDDYNKYKKDTGNVVTIMRMDSNGKFTTQDYNLPDGQAKIALNKLSEDDQDQ